MDVPWPGSHHRGMVVLVVVGFFVLVAVVGELIRIRNRRGRTGAAQAHHEPPGSPIREYVDQSQGLRLRSK